MQSYILAILVTSSVAFQLNPHLRNVVRASTQLRRSPPNTHDLDDALLRRGMFKMETADDPSFGGIRERVKQMCKWMWSVNAYTEYTQLKVATAFREHVRTTTLFR